jgi:hypothetical protein
MESSRETGERRAREAEERFSFDRNWPKIESKFLQWVWQVNEHATPDECGELVKKWHWTKRAAERLRVAHNKWVSSVDPGSLSLLSTQDVFLRYLKALYDGEGWKRYQRLHHRWWQQQPQYKAWKRQYDKRRYRARKHAEALAVLENAVGALSLASPTENQEAQHLQAPC